MRLILLSIIGLLCLAYALALSDNGHHLEDLLGVAHHGGNHAEGGARLARGYGNYGRGNYGHAHGHHGGGGHGYGHGHYGR
ncbi:glycine-rich cell wall structural protein-like [Drosophila eugracilis]|uniref:glycine-rich cell wall structural protein-like n=1 Tax=Drosophila eugracilis TaxID=29029 RepID=UPI0007E67B78|nr:glycine-rich cell wall structural protein-like [Drosophila eugracilis]